MLWTKLYSKVRADALGFIAGGGLTTGVLYVLEAAGADSDPTLKALVVAAAGFITGKVAAYLKVETGPITRQLS